MDNIKVKIIDSEVRQLLAGDRLNLLAVVERVPKLRDEEEIFALYKAILDRTSNTLSDLE